MATAGLSDAQKVANLTPEQLKRLLALVQGSAGTSNNSADFGQWTGTGDLAGYTVDRRRDVTGTSPNGPDTFSDPRTRIYQSTGSSKWKTDGETANVWDDQGNYIGPSSGDSTELGLAKFIAASVGGYYGAGAINGAGAAAGGAAGGGTQATFTANDVAMMAANGMTDAQIAVAVGPEAASGLGLAGPGTGMTFAEATTLAAQQAGTPGLNNVGNGLQEPAAPPADPATPPPADAAAKAAADAAAKAAAEKAATGAALTAAEKALLDAAIKAGTIVATTAVTKALADEVVDSSTTDDAKFSKMFDAMFADYQKMSARGDDMWNNYLTTFRPLEQKFAASAAGFDTPTRRETAANDATGQVASEYDQQRQTAQRNMISAGVDPSTMYALDQSSRIVQAKDQAQAANKARSDTELQGLSLVKSAADFGRGISTGATQLQQVGQTGANAATNNATGLANVQTQNTNSRNALYSDLFGAIGTGLGAWAANYNKGP